jgi:uncharacterized membrane protein
VVSAVVTEHFVLQSARGAATSEAGGRLSGLLATVSGALVAAGFIAGTPAAPAFFAVVIPFLVLLGLLTYRRLVEISVEDVLYVRAIQEIRRWYADSLPPGLPPSMAAPLAAPIWSLAATRMGSGLVPLLSTTASVVALVTAVLAGGGAALLAAALTGSTAAAAVAAAVVTLVAVGLFVRDQARRFTRALGR